MDIDFEAAVKYPFADEDWLRTVGIGGGLFALTGVLSVVMFVLYAIPFVNIVALLFTPVFLLVVLAVYLPVTGYLVRVSRGTVRGEAIPPTFDDPGSLARDGAIAIVIGFLYFIPLAAILAVLLVIGIGVAVAAGDAGSIVFLIGQFVFYAVTAVYSLAVAYLMPVSLITYADTENVRTAFSLDHLRGVALDKRYALVWIIGYVGMQVLNQFAGVMIVFIVGFFLQFLIMVVYVRLLSLGYAQAMEYEGSDEASQRAPEYHGL